MMKYKGYAGVVAYDDEAKLFHGEVVSTRSVITFQGTSVQEIEREFRVSVDSYLDWCAERGKQPEKPYSGKFMVRIGPDAHRKIAIAAARSRKTMNGWVQEVLENAADDELEVA